MNSISTLSLSKRFGADWILRDVDFRCESGEFVAILGASGCGKSTLLRILSGLTDPTSGRVDHQIPRSKISFVFQSPTLCPWLKVWENIALPLKIRGRRRSEQREVAATAIRLVGLQPADGDKLPQQLSGGMQMRASLGRSLVTKPQLLLLDEPFAAVDEVLRQQLNETCLQLWTEQQWSTVLVTHNVAEAAYMSQRILLLAGRPAKICDEITVPFPTRDPALRTSIEFNQFVADVSQKLRQQVEGP